MLSPLKSKESQTNTEITYGGDKSCCHSHNPSTKINSRNIGSITLNASRNEGKVNKAIKLESTSNLSIKDYPYLHIAYIILFNVEQNQGKVTIMRYLTDQAAVTIKQLQGNYS